MKARESIPGRGTAYAKAHRGESAWQVSGTDGEAEVKGHGKFQEWMVRLQQCARPMVHSPKGQVGHRTMGNGKPRQVFC